MIRKRLLISTLACIPCAFYGASALADGDPRDAAIEALQAQINALQNQLNDLKKRQAQAEQRAGQSDPVRIKWGLAPTLSDPDGDRSMKLRGRVVADFGFVSDGDNTFDTKASHFREVRIGMQGSAWRDFSYIVEADFAGNKVSLKDAYLQWNNDLFYARAGHFKEYGGLDESTSLLNISALERPAFTDAFGYTERMGIGMGWLAPMFTFEVGAFQGPAGDSFEDEGLLLAARGTYNWRPGKEQLIHAGVWVKYRDMGDDQAARSYSVKPGSNLASSRLVATPALAEDELNYGVELAGIFGPVTVAAEGSINEIDPRDTATYGTGVTFWGGYVDISYALTGEHRVMSKGAFKSPIVSNPVNEGGGGAWLISGRYDYVDLSDGAVLGGKQESWIATLSWFANPYVRVKANYSYVSVRDALMVAINGADGRNSANSFTLRTQVDW